MNVQSLWDNLSTVSPSIVMAKLEQVAYSFAYYLKNTSSLSFTNMFLPKPCGMLSSYLIAKLSLLSLKISTSCLIKEAKRAPSILYSKSRLKHRHKHTFVWRHTTQYNIVS
mmetsp:Transcript_32386/g.38696  ORF Transcript_32386/g.38696 Transcript_32386/m.38696 type:complete len:111 (+) Transcript_32386:1725-2057(+)